MNPGLFKHKIIIQKYIESENSMGDSVRSWQDHITTWAMIKTIQGREFIQAAAVQGENTTRFVIRYNHGITSDMRILYNGRIFEISAPPINDDEANKTLTIMAKEVV
jgi:SPP1 family predicted phage head-tail adaptor